MQTIIKEYQLTLDTTANQAIPVGGAGFEILGIVPKQGQFFLSVKEVVTTNDPKFIEIKVLLSNQVFNSQDLVGFDFVDIVRTLTNTHYYVWYKQ